jgi:hypothetical protein
MQDAASSMSVTALKRNEKLCKIFPDLSLVDWIMIFSSSINEALQVTFRAVFHDDE